MKDIDHFIESLKKDYCDQQYPGDLGDLVRSSNEIAPETDLDKPQLETAPPNLDLEVNRERTTGIRPVRWNLRITTAATALSAALIGTVLWIGTWLSQPGGDKTIADSDPTTSEHVASLNPSTSSDPSTPVAETNSSVPNSAAPRPRLRRKTLSLVSAIPTSVSKNSADQTSGKPRPALGLYLTKSPANRLTNRPSDRVSNQKTKSTKPKTQKRGPLQTRRPKKLDKPASVNTASTNRPKSSKRHAAKQFSKRKLRYGSLALHHRLPRTGSRPSSHPQSTVPSSSKQAAKTKSSAKGSSAVKNGLKSNSKSSVKKTAKKQAFSKAQKNSPRIRPQLNTKLRPLRSLKFWSN